MVLKIPERNVQINREDFQPNEAVEAMKIFRDLPDGTTEILFRTTPKTKNWSRQPFNPENPRTVILLEGDFEIPTATGMHSDRSAEAGLRRIVIDPGHGGRDQGALGPTGLKEKDVILDLGRRLKQELDGEYEMQMTRRDDTLLSLKARTGMANHFKADLFLSIHLNAINLPNATGSETYYLSMDAQQDVDSDHYGEDENEDDAPAVAEPVVDEELSMMLWDMAQTKHSEDSFRIAKYIQESLNILSGTRNRGVKQAPLKVLKGANMPAVLVEVAFISNPNEERKLKTDRFREQIVRAIARAIRRYDEDVKRRAQPVGVLGEDGR
jgi:N-acetylmuramoyl-L-alanine amidase